MLKIKIKSQVIKRVLLTLFYVLIFLVGRYIPIPNVPLDGFRLADNEAFSFGTSITGGNLSQIGLFSIGLGPWMYATILSRVFTIGKIEDKSTTTKMRDLRNNSVMLVIATIQSLGIAGGLDYGDTSIPIFEFVAMTSLIFIAGAFVLVWIANQISAKGIGGPSLLVLANILLSQDRLAMSVRDYLVDNGWFLVFVIMLWTLLAIFLMILFEYAEYRIPVKRVGINNELASDTYMPIKVNSAGGLPIMYAYSLLMLPQYLIMLLKLFIDKEQLWEKIADYFTTANLIGVFLYMLIIFFLTLSFGYINFDTVRTAENMRASGDYIEGIRPGKPTQKLLSHLVGKISGFSGVVMALLVGFPLFLALGKDSLQPIATLTGIGMMITGMIISFRDEIKTANIMKQYKSLFE